MKPKERTIILIDGSNFYFKLKDLANILCLKIKLFKQLTMSELFGLMAQKNLQKCLQIKDVCLLI